MKPTLDWPNWPRIGEWQCPASHPALPGHFPGFPVVPGALLLDASIAQIEAWSTARVTEVRDARFQGAALPEQPLVLHAQRDGTTVRFALAGIGEGRAPAATGTLTLDRE